MIIINLSNQIGAGPRNISLNMIRAVGDLDEPGRITFLTTDDPTIGEALRKSRANYRVVPTYANPLLKVMRFCFVQALLIHMTISGKFHGILAFGNFLLVGSAQKKAVLMHHPYLVDDVLIAQLPGFSRFLERVKRALFRWTLGRVDTVIVQSDYMRDMFRQMYPEYKRALTVIPNPVSSSFSSQIVGSETIKGKELQEKPRFSMLYASRFYPHKNHAFLIELARSFTAKRVPVDLIVTLNPAIPGAADFLATVEREQLAIRNIGEVSQARLAQEYLAVDAAIFPSRAETFGNPLVEAIRFALPVVAPRKGYSFAVLGDSGIYFDEDDADGCADVCAALFSDSSRYADASDKASRQSQIYPEAADWIRAMLSVVDG